MVSTTTAVGVGFSVCVGDDVGAGLGVWGDVCVRVNVGVGLIGSEQGSADESRRRSRQAPLRYRRFLSLGTRVALGMDPRKHGGVTHDIL